MALPKLLTVMKKTYIEGELLHPSVEEKIKEYKKIYSSLEKKSLSDNDKAIIKKDIERTSVKSTKFYINPDFIMIRNFKALLESISKYEVSGYTEGMNFIAAFLLDHMNAPEAFFAFTAMMNHPNLNLRQMFEDELSVSMVEMFVILYLIKEHIPKSRPYMNSLHDAMIIMEMNPFVSPFMKLFVEELPYEVTSLIWDCLLRHGRKVIYATFLVMCKRNDKLFLTSKRPFDDIYAKFKEVSPSEANDLIKEISKFAGAISDKTIKTYRKKAPEY